VTEPESEIDYAALFASTPSPYLVLDTGLVIVDANPAYLQVTRRSRDQLIGQYLFDAFPGNPVDPEADGARNLRASLHRVLSLRERDTMAVQRYDIPAPERPGVFEERWWSPVNTPVLAPDGTVRWIIHRVEDVTAFVLARRSGPPADGTPGGREESTEAELYVRGRELERMNEELRQSKERERHVAVTLQEAMLRSPDLGHHHRDVAVRYLPAVRSLNVCGDWYDIADLPGDRFAVAVGDVVGHGLEAASVMGMLRSALSAACRAVEGPARALELLGLYARSVDGALAATVVTALVDSRSHLIIYSSAGHPPPILVHPDGMCELLDQATDPPLGARPEHVPRPQAGLPYHQGDALALYTDGLIERPGEDIDTGLTRLTDALASHSRLPPEHLADTVLGRLGVGGGGRDDVALVIVRL
jgi:serine phosphatase RsbU (regulator of sigma subunit)